MLVWDRAGVQYKIDPDPYMNGIRRACGIDSIFRAAYNYVTIVIVYSRT
jgi:hypothetical protein